MGIDIFFFFYERIQFCAPLLESIVIEVLKSNLNSLLKNFE